MLKTTLINLFKLSIAAGLVAWLLQSGKLDFRLLIQLQNHPLAVLSAMGLCVFNFWLCSLRWKNILKARSLVDIPTSGILQVQWIGQFFSSVLPGSVSGDIVKSLYVQRFDPSFSKRFIFASILIDRVMGLSGLILIVGLSSIFFSNHILENAPAMKPLLDVNYLLAAGVLLALFLFFFFHPVIRMILIKAEKLCLSAFWLKIISLWDDLVMIRPQMIKAVFISLTVQFLSVVIFWCLISPFVAGHMDFIQAMAFIPLGSMAMALPVAPSGLGVGHAIFQKLFEFSGITNGASLFNLYFVVTLVVNLFGVIPYLWIKSHPKK